MSKKLNPTSGTATFRLASTTLEELHQEAEQKRTSLNTLVSQVLQSHTEYHTFASKAGMVSMPKSLLISLMKSMDTQEEVSRLSQKQIAKNEFRDIVLLMKGNYTSESIIDFIKSWARANGFPYRYHHYDISGDDDGNSKVNVNDDDNSYSLYQSNNNSSNYNNKKRPLHSFVIQHDMGESWSLYFVELFKFAFQQVGIKVNSAYTANTISLEM